jgi:hypothetical protein
MSHKVAVNDYVPRVFSGEKNGISLKRFEQAVERLFEAKQIHAQSYGPPSKQRCYDREAMSFLATTSGVSGENVRDLMLAAVEHRFGPVNRLPVTIEWLSDNGSC